MIFSWIIERPLNFAQQPTFYIAVISDYLQTSIFYSTPSCFFSHFSLIFPSSCHHKFYIHDKASQKGPRTVQSTLQLVTLCSFSLFVLLLQELTSPSLRLFICNNFMFTRTQAPEGNSHSSRRAMAMSVHISMSLLSSFLSLCPWCLEYCQSSVKVKLIY